MNRCFKRFSSLAFATILAAAVSQPAAAMPNDVGNRPERLPRTVTLTRAELLDKIKGGWAAQTIGVTYGTPTEFRYTSGMIGDDVVIPWGDPDYVRNTMINAAGAYDDIYMDLTFVEVMERLGIDAPADSMAVAFAYADYPLWHANQAARYNILYGTMPPASGHCATTPMPTT